MKTAKVSLGNVVKGAQVRVDRAGNGHSQKVERWSFYRRIFHDALSLELLAGPKCWINGNTISADAFRVSDPRGYGCKNFRGGRFYRC